MPSIPLPFLTAIFLGLVLLRLWGAGGRHFSSLFLVTLLFYCAQSVLAGINWGISALPPLTLALVAITLPPLTWASLQDLMKPVSVRLLAGVSALIVALALAMYATYLVGWGVGPDIIIALTYLSFGVSLVQEARHGDLSWAENQPFHMVMPAKLAFLSAGVLFVVSAFVDTAVAIDFAVSGGRNAPTLVTAATLTMLCSLVALYLYVTTRSVHASDASSSAALPRTDPELVSALERLKALMESERLYRKENLSLEMLSKASRLPSRQISEAVNALEQQNVPQFVNGYRVREACKLLQETKATITQIMFDVGFTTKSNFNKEFQRVTGMSPSAYRAHSRKVDA
ncbi:AraC family transcriptional regulator [Pseudovibrio exalbescens]|uniref:helix-turn-helix domain-containing protein n=1 Tax=Pseudovibrio exalbescens TaxID=197461 RepID=UPI00236605F1|nr:AraC family transcriptional regulator [Pseudovibrio exalbescens]MDD7909242.1 AraC family transcriptional regulator [Pseudovibrio exalbescens]